MSNDISTMYTKDRNQKTGRKGCNGWQRWSWWILYSCKKYNDGWKIMDKEIKYTSENLFDIKNLRHTIYCQIEECNIQKRILDVKIKTLQEIVNALDRHIGSIEGKEKDD